MKRRRFIPVEEARARLTERIARDGYRAVAAAAGVTESYVRNVEAGRKGESLSAALARSLGLERGFGEVPRGR